MRIGTPPVSSAAIIAGLGYTPVNKAGDTMLGDLLFTDGLYDIGKNGTTRPRNVFASGDVKCSGVTTSSNIISGGNFFFGSSTRMLAPADGLLLLTNDAQTGFTRLQFGGTTSAFPALLRNGTDLRLRLADDSNYGAFTAGDITAANSAAASLYTFVGFSASLSISAGTGSPEGVRSAVVGSIWIRTNGGASTTLYVKESGTGNTGWVAK